MFIAVILPSLSVVTIRHRWTTKWFQDLFPCIAFPVLLPFGGVKNNREQQLLAGVDYGTGINVYQSNISVLSGRKKYRCFSLPPSSSLHSSAGIWLMSWMHMLRVLSAVTVNDTAAGLASAIFPLAVQSEHNSIMSIEHGLQSGEEFSLSASACFWR